MKRAWRRLSQSLPRRMGSLFRHHRFGLYILAVVVGLASGLGAVLFRLGIDAWSQLLSGADDYTESMGPSVGSLAALGTGASSPGSWAVSVVVWSGLWPSVMRTSRRRSARAAAGRDRRVTAVRSPGRRGRTGL